MRILTSFAVMAALALAGCVSNTPNDLANIQPTEELMAAVYSPARPAEDVARDEARLPLETITFAGVRRGQVIAEMAPGGGYYTRILAQAVGPEGRIFALMPARFANRPGGLDTINAIAEQYGNVEVVVVDDYGTLVLPQQVDLIWTTENYHDFINADVDAVNRWALDALKPGGIFFIEDHDAPGAGTSVTSTLHRVDADAVREIVTAAGFRFEAESDHLDNPADPHTQSPFDYEGATDKFVMRFRRTG